MHQSHRLLNPMTVIITRHTLSAPKLPLCGLIQTRSPVSLIRLNEQKTSGKYFKKKKKKFKKALDRRVTTFPSIHVKQPPLSYRAAFPPIHHG